jgi:hypothetical protein
MSRKLILTLAAAATVAAASFATSSASYAHGPSFGGGGAGGGGGGGGGGHHSGASHFSSANHFARLNQFTRVSHLPRLHEPRDPGRHIGLHEHHKHWIFRNGMWIEVDDVEVGDTVDVAPAVVPGPCTCLTKNYTPTGLVVFADICTKESASAPIDSSADAAQAPTTPPPAAQAPAATATPSNFAGRTYQDYLAANPQAETQAPAKN